MALGRKGKGKRKKAPARLTRGREQEPGKRKREGSAVVHLEEQGSEGRGEKSSFSCALPGGEERMSQKKLKRGREGKEKPFVDT